MADFQEHLAGFHRLGCLILAGSVDSRQDANRTVDELSLTFPVAWGLDAQQTAAAIGGYFQQEKGFLHAAGFVLNPEGKTLLAVTSSGAIGRLTAADSLKLIDHLQQA